VGDQFDHAAKVMHRVVHRGRGQQEQLALWFLPVSVTI
jgi:hypothetical protein